MFPLLFLLAEFIVFVVIAKWIGFGWALLAYFLPTFLAAFLLRRFSKGSVLEIQRQMSQQSQVGPTMLGLAIRLLGTVLLLIPFFSTRMLGLLLFLPGMNHLLFSLVQVWLLKKMKAGQFVFMGGLGRQAGYPGGFQRGFERNFDRSAGQGFGHDSTRDTVIDVEAREVVDVQLIEDSNTNRRPQND